ncbi:MAG: 50S ribosomal protein L11 methyltransferase [Anaerolineales bacterium]|nr:50S ribosomal protein L11 methyltransferase [Anaerolineales bacterium]
MSQITWMEVSLKVEGELAEAVAEVMSRYMTDGVVVQSTEVVNLEDTEGGHAIGPLLVCGYLPLDEQYEETRQRLEEALWYLSRIAQDRLGALPKPQYRQVAEVNWVEAWKEHYHPIPVGERLIIVPAWLEVDSGARIPVRIDPGMAFGTGTHPTTQLCLEIVDTWLQGATSGAGQPSPDVIDIGCGSGILSIGALKLGARAALGVDIDPQAVESARQNAQSNGVAQYLELGVGSVDEVLGGRFGLRQGGIVFANILAPILERLLDAGLGRLIAPGGVLILSGILEEQIPHLETFLTKHNLQLHTRRQVGDWVALAVVPR